MEEQKEVKEEEQVKEEKIEEETEFSFFDNFDKSFDNWLNQENI